jgi:hypothetical protein
MINAVMYSLEEGGRFFLMPLAPGRLRGNGIVDRHRDLWTLWTFDQWSRALSSHSRVRSFKITPMTLLPRIEGFWPPLIRLGMQTAGRIRPDWFHYFIIEGSIH